MVGNGVTSGAPARGATSDATRQPTASRARAELSSNARARAKTIDRVQATARARARAAGVAEDGAEGRQG